MKSHRWVGAHRGKFQACSGTEESSDNGFIDTILLPPKKFFQQHFRVTIRGWAEDRRFICLSECFYFNLQLFQSGD